jgi:hypothetical protein
MEDVWMKFDKEPDVMQTSNEPETAGYLRNLENLSS